jgi:hypothetical protein
LSYDNYKKHLASKDVCALTAGEKEMKELNKQQAAIPIKLPGMSSNPSLIDAIPSDEAKAAAIQLKSGSIKHIILVLSPLL